MANKDKSLTGHWCTSSGLFRTELFQLPVIHPMIFFCTLTHSHSNFTCRG